MASVGEVIYEDFLYKFTGRSRSIFWGKANPWREKYFILKRLGNKPVLEYFNKKPKIKNMTPKGKVELWPSFRVEKITNMKNRAYVFQLTTPAATLCLSADEQRSMDMFVFFLQIQSRLKEQIATEVYSVESENSEALRRIGARGTNCVLHISPYGVTLALQSNKAVLAQWPLKSIRSYESSERGQFSIEAGRIAPMGDGLYIFNMELGEDTIVYDVLDRFVMDNLTKLQPGNRGDAEELEDYVLEAERLLALTVVSACTTDNPDVRHIVNNNWNTDLIHTPNTRPRQIVHTRLKTTVSSNSISSQNTVQGVQSAPARAATERGTPQAARSQPAFQNSPAGFRRESNQSPGANISNRPPLPPPSSSIPNQSPSGLKLQGKFMNKSLSEDSYLRMNSTSSTSSIPFSPSPSDNIAPPRYRDAVKHESCLSQDEPYDPSSYLLPSPTVGPVTSTPNHRLLISAHNEYLTPLSPTPEEVNNNGDISARPKVFQDNYADMSGSIVHHQERTRHRRIRRLKSVSCDDVSDYLRSVVYDPKSKSMDDLLDADESSLAPEPFPRLQTYSGPERHGDYVLENYYNIEGLKGKIYDGPGLPVNELIYRFSKKARHGRGNTKLRRSVSNPNFIGIVSKNKLHSARVHAGYTAKMNHNSLYSSSISNLLPDSLKKHLNREHHRGSQGALSSGAASSKNSSKASSRSSSTRTSPANMRKTRSLPRDEVIASAGVKGINITRRSRSFRKQKPDEYVNLKHGHHQTEHARVDKSSEHTRGDKSSEHARGDKSSEHVRGENDENNSADTQVNGTVVVSESDSVTDRAQQQGPENSAVGLTVLGKEERTSPAKKEAPKTAPRTAPKPKVSTVLIEGSETTSV